jgi:hypothetical protein
MKEAVGAVVLVGALFGGVHLATETAHADGVNLPARTYQQANLCPSEDSTNCAWNAHAQGNGHGYSFYAVTRKLRGRNGHVWGSVICHEFVNLNADGRYGECQVVHRNR